MFISRVMALLLIDIKYVVSLSLKIIKIYELIAGLRMFTNQLSF